MPERKMPEWLEAAETCCGWYSADAPDEEAVGKLRLFDFIVWGNMLTGERIVRKLQAEGIRALPYISMYKAPALSRINLQRHWNGGSAAREEVEKNPFWQAMNLDEHPKWRLINEAGEVQRPFRNPDYSTGWDQVCCNQPGHKEAVLEGVRGLMEWGADGLFIDNVHPEEICYGSQKGIHKHLKPELNNSQAYLERLEEVYQLVKTYGDDKIIFLNSGSRCMNIYAKWGDAVMIEGYICSSGPASITQILGKDYKVSPPGRRHHWDWVLTTARDTAEFFKGRTRIVALSYLGYSNFSLKDDLFYTYACARLSDFAWADWLSAKTPLAEHLYKLRLGRPLQEIKEASGIFYREYPKGLVVVNPGEREKEASLGLVRRSGQALDLYNDEPLEISQGKVRVKIPPQSGRIYTF